MYSHASYVHVLRGRLTIKGRDFMRSLEQLAVVDLAREGASTDIMMWLKHKRNGFIGAAR